MSKIRLHGTSSGYTEIAPVAASGNNTLTLPNDGTIISKDSNGAVGVTSVVTTTATITTAKVGAAVTISESGIEASGIGITCANINGGQVGGRRNKVINGAMNICQRATTFAVTGSTNAYVVPDRFKCVNVHDGAYTLTQSTTSPEGFSSSIKVDVTTADTSLTTSQRLYIAHFIEAQDLQDLGYGTSSAKEVRVSFYVRSNKTGNYTFALNQADNSFKNLSFQYAISSADTWERKSFVIPGDTAGVINNDNGTGIELYWWLAAGPTYTSGSLRSDWTAYSNGDFAAGQGVNLLDSTSNEWYLTGVQFEVGSQVTPFEHCNYQDEFLRCNRYFYFTNAQYFFTARGNNSDGLVGFIPTVVPLRASPSISMTAGLRHWGIDSNSSSTTLPTIPSFRANQNGIRVNQTGHSGVNDDCVMAVQTDGSDGQGISFDAEL